MADRKPSLPRKILRKTAMALAALMLLGAFYLAVVLGQPQPDENALNVQSDQPLMTASPAQTLSSEAELQGLMARFPVPVLYAQGGGALTLRSGTSQDMAYEDGFARIITLVYAAQVNGQDAEITVQSIYPARALSLIPKVDYTIAAVAGPSVAGLATVRMENARAIRLHAQSADALYAVTLPKVSSPELGALLRPLQLSGETPLPLMIG